MSTISSTKAGHGSRHASAQFGPKPSPESPRETWQGQGPGDGLPALGGFAACGLDGTPRNACQARRFVTITLNGWELEPLVPDMALIVSELVTNAVRHGLTTEAQEAAAEYPLWLGLVRQPGHVVCSVTDPSPEPPRPRSAADTAPDGRGLALIGALSDSWSWSPMEPRGKTVWASLALPGPALPAPQD
ncbi:ATP-binding protein [Streptomyces formicae]|uniref:ATP-binding protein n=1 Tax=Streptomyces formicae TaxID=1616117 RepID=A0ABY3WV17_9ACTN|nr:ATP-binding protein [Streptomyces formicae]